MEPIKQYLINSITLDGYTDENGNEYNEANMTDGEKITAAKRNFESEMGWLIERSGQHRACVDWLSGLCSTVSIAFNYSDIIELAYKTGGLKEGDNEKREDYICENYFPYMATKLLQLFNK
tara:strand:+ start:593 stop:955 length:363 start_codon:yes stop_codon:yes gene_type:complete